MFVGCDDLEEVGVFGGGEFFDVGDFVEGNCEEVVGVVGKVVEY